ncbi:MAG: UDP-2,3-diacylglucosamine diphosphatase LpxI [Phycisphaerae bacterium]
MPPPLGLIAGAGELPKLVARGARRAGLRVAAVGLRGFVDRDVRELVDEFHVRGVARLGGWIRSLRRCGCREVVMVGRVRKADMFAGPRWRQWLQYLPDLTSIRVWYFATRDKRNDTLLAAVADEMSRHGLTMIDSTTHIRDALAEEGVLAGGSPPGDMLADADFAWPIAKQIAALDVGQAVAVKEREIIAVEAIEGTDALIERTGKLCPAGGWTLVKVAKPNQDMRFDVPTIGPQTIENLHRAGARGLVVEAGMTIVLDREKLAQAAGRARICVMARRGAAGGA